MNWTTESRIFWLVIGVILGLLTMMGLMLTFLTLVLRLALGMAGGPA